MEPHTITPAVGAVCRCKAKAGLRRSPRGLYTRTRLSSLLRLNLDLSLKARPGSIPLQPSFLAHSTSPNGGFDGRASRLAHVMGAAIPNVLGILLPWNLQMPNLEMVYAISRQIWKRYNELVAKSGNDIMN
ncbi:e3 ubiquitin-protein ligase RNF13 [Trichonephila clavipes]|nr:e3 ubiquitin-protein ligase RNF13 [Trichonephila clavipes]